VTPKELQRRKNLVASIRRLREEIGPIGVRTDVLVHQGRNDLDGVE